MTTETKKVYGAISKAMEILAKEGIAKNSKNEAQKFKYRSIDAVMNACAIALVEAKLVVLPRYTHRDVTEKTSTKGGMMIHTVLTSEFDFVSVEDGSTHTVLVYGEAAGFGDKSHNAAMSIAFKYALLQSLCVPTEAIDPDAESPEFKATEVGSEKNAKIETKTQETPRAQVKEEKRVVRYLFPADHPRIDEVRESAKDLGFSCSTIGSVVNVVAEKEVAAWAKFLVRGA